jgi:hypothetical protein
MNKIVLALLAASAATVAALPAAANNLIVNGDFESPGAPAGSLTLLGGGSTALTGWNVTGPADNAIYIINTTYTEPNALFTAESGSNSLDITGSFNSGPTSGVNQDVTTVVGQKYRLSFWVGNQDGSDNPNYLSPSTVNLSIDGGPTIAETNANTSTHVINWEEFTDTFTATGTTTNISFLNGTPLTDAEGGLDNVSLTAVPEPASWAMMLVGFGGLGVAMRGRRRAIA